MTEPLAFAIIVGIVLVAYVLLKLGEDRQRRRDGEPVEPWPWDRWRNQP